jgi:hypothetical protein
MSTTLVQRDERTTVVENASYRWAYLFLSFGLLAVVAYRSFVLGESSWDLLGLVILGGVVTTVYQGFHRVLGKQWVWVTAVTVAIACALAAGLALLR